MTDESAAARASFYADDAVVAVYDFRRLGEATALASRAWGALAEGFPSDPALHTKRMKRLDRVRQAFRVEHVERIAAPVAQWLSARAAPAAAPDARDAVQAVPDLRRRARRASGSLATLSEALAFATATAEGREAQGLAQLLSAALDEVERTLAAAQEWAGQLEELLPGGARGRLGVVGTFTEKSADEALAIDLARLWRAHGLTLAGGNDGDGLDVVVSTILRDRKATERALAAARRAPGIS